MAKGGRDKEGKSALEQAWRALEAGDVVSARRLATQVATAPTSDDEAAAARVSQWLIGDRSAKGQPVREGELLPDAPDARALANNMLARIRPPARPYLWALGGAAAFAGLLVLAVVRYG
jgi:hypothetical protein